MVFNHICGKGPCRPISPYKTNIGSALITIHTPSHTTLWLCTMNRLYYWSMYKTYYVLKQGEKLNLAPWFEVNSSIYVNFVCHFNIYNSEMISVKRKIVLDFHCKFMKHLIRTKHIQILEKNNTKSDLMEKSPDAPFQKYFWNKIVPWQWVQNEFISEKNIR